MIDQPASPRDAAMQEVRQYLEQQRRAHLAADAAAMADLFADDFVSISNGRISRPTRVESLARFQNYFGSVTFLAWEDLTPPQVWASDDGSLATALVHKRVHLTYRDEAGAAQEEETIFAWQETYARRDGRLRLICVVSTNA
jgi:ketosteroid isomerase-like protein